MTTNPVVDWFGSQFGQLHPLLQDLHRHGGRLSGTVNVDVGRGLAGWIGRRIARKRGVPTDRAGCGFHVDIRHRDGALLWTRHFDGQAAVPTVFRPVGRWPDGYWEEITGKTHIHLTVDVRDGGWYWRPLGVTHNGWRVPLWLFPGPGAYKRIEDGRYVFSVTIALPLIGTVLRYHGALDAVPDAEAGDHVRNA